MTNTLRSHQAVIEFLMEMGAPPRQAGELVEAELQDVPYTKAEVMEVFRDYRVNRVHSQR